MHILTPPHSPFPPTLIKTFGTLHIALWGLKESG